MLVELQDAGGREEASAPGERGGGYVDTVLPRGWCLEMEGSQHHGDQYLVRGACGWCDATWSKGPSWVGREAPCSKSLSHSDKD